MLACGAAGGAICSLGFGISRAFPFDCEGGTGSGKPSATGRECGSASGNAATVAAVVADGCSDSELEGCGAAGNLTGSVGSADDLGLITSVNCCQSSQPSS